MNDFFRVAVGVLSLSIFSLASAENINHFEGVANAISSPTFTHRVANAETPFISMERIAGCLGDTATARQNIVSSHGLIKEPLFQNEKHIPSTFALADKSESVCLTDDDPIGLQKYAPMVMSIENYFSDDFFCGCGECSNGQDGEPFPQSELAQRLTDTHKAEYAAYNKRRTKEIEVGKKQHKKYAEEYQTWQAKKQKALGNESLRITITPKQDVAAGTMTIYNYSWFQYRWCGALSDANRENLQTKQVSHPAIKAGESLDVWLDDVNLDLFWGVLLHAPGTTPEEDFQELDAANKKAIKEGNYESPPLFFRALPESLEGRIFETPSGRSEQILDDCCAC